MGEIIFFLAPIVHHFAKDTWPRAETKVGAYAVMSICDSFGDRHLCTAHPFGLDRVHRDPFTTPFACRVEPLDNMSEVGPSSPFGESPLTIPPSTTPTPEPLNKIPQRNFWVELRRATSEERDYGEFHLNLREIAAEHTEGSKEFYYALLGDNKYHKVRALNAQSN